MKLNRNKIVYVSAGTAAIVAVLLALLFMLTRPALEVVAVNVTVPVVTSPATGIRVEDPAYVTALSNALTSADIPFIVIDTVTIGVSPESLEAAKQALINPNGSGQPFEYSVVTTNVSEPETITRVENTSPTDTTQSKPFDFVPLPQPANSKNLPNESQVEFLPRGEIKDLNQSWSPTSTLANSNYVAMFAIFPNTQVAQTAKNWLSTSVELGNSLAASYWAPTTDPTVLMAVIQVPDDVLTALTNAVNGNVTYSTEVGLAFIVETPWTQPTAAAVVKTLPLPMIVVGTANAPLLQYLGQTPTLEQFNALGEALKKAGIKNPTAIGFS